MALQTLWPMVALRHSSRRLLGAFLANRLALYRATAQSRKCPAKAVIAQIRSVSSSALWFCQSSRQGWNLAASTGPISFAVSPRNLPELLSSRRPGSSLFGIGQL